MSSYLACNSCGEHANKDYTAMWINVVIKIVDIEFQADYCPECWAKEFVKRLAPVVGEVGKEDDDCDSDSPDVGADDDGS